MHNPLPRRVRQGPNISEVERWGSMIGGAALTLYGLTRLRRRGWILATFGVLLFWRGATRHCYTYDLLGISTAVLGSGLGARRSALGEEHAVSRNKTE
jgi:hypothetical protein